jgi:uncharacterized alkaline shock family protein YloU
MDALNRVFASILGLILIAVGVIGILATAGVFDAQTFLDGFFSETITRLSEGSDTTTIVSYAVSSALIVLGLILLALEVMQLTATDDMILITDDSSGMTQVSSRSVVRLCERVAMSNRDVTSCDCTLVRAPEGMTIACKTKLRLGADVPEVTSELQSSLRDAVESLVGLPVAHVYIDAKYAGRAERSLVAG